MRMQTETREYVLRALAAAEIAETCLDPKERASFLALAEAWLDEAAQADGRKRRRRATVH